MTSIYFVRHAQPNSKWEDDRTKPLTKVGMEDSKRVTEILKDIEIDVFYSSPFRRSMDTILDCANHFNMIIHTDERLRERKTGVNSSDYLKQRWDDFDFCEEEGENIKSVQQRNMEALNDILNRHPDKNIVIGTHGTALSTILNFYDPSFGYDGFKRIHFSMPYIIRLDFNGTDLIRTTELLKMDRGYE
ncbi:MAG: histidine phosphatase family protein [Clostridiales bacterium]|nr:histidine phosphatase family protein [Clostridiales bacterium]